MKNKKNLSVWLIVGAGILLSIVVIRLISGEKIGPGLLNDVADNTSAPESTVQASIETITEWYEAVGTVRPRTETRIEAQVTAQVTDVKFSPGAKVKKGEILLTLDNRQLLSRLDQARQALKSAVARKEQARQAVIAAKAAHTQAESAFKRTQTYFASQAATSHDLENAESVYLQARAGLTKAKEGLSGADAQIHQAEEVVKEAEIALGYTIIRAPESGEVLKRLVEPGDLALPGKPLIFLQTSGFLRLEAYVREGLIKLVTPGRQLSIHIDTLGKTTDAIVEEIVPYADPRTRTFLVKAAMPHMPGVYPGMYGKLLIPIKEQKVVLVPRSAVRQVGQLELVKVREGDQWKTRFIKTGKVIGDKVEILSGLSGDETIGL
ncbi:MAG: efflux RND transporter periplasmic adaptor subunit [Deltaproteobacteria bacterium]|nr:efflux RND transporter periplasmic adaptor subunit [Deltaproteobacteria bacterium]